MEFSFCSLNFLLFFISVMLVNFRTYGNPSVSNEIQALQQELKDVVMETETLKKGKDALIKEINSTEISCNETLIKLIQSRNSLITTLLKQNQTVGSLMQRLLDEDLTHEKLESKLKELYSDLDVSGVIYETEYQELFLLEGRRLNGTDLHCETIIKKLEEPKTNINKIEIQTRSLSSWLTKFRENNLNKNALQNRINIAKIEEFQLKSDHQALALKKESNKEMCSLKESNLKKQIASIEEVLKSLEDTIAFLNSDMHTSIFLTESLKVEIKFGKELLSAMKKNILKFKKVKESFKRDKQCYAAIKHMA